MGYGDKAPITMAGRFLGVIWMFLGLVLFGLFSGLVSSSLSTDGPVYLRDPITVRGMADLQTNLKGKVCILQGVAETVLKDYGISNTLAVANINDCYERLVIGDNVSIDRQDSPMSPS